MLRVHVVRYMYDERWSYTDAHDNCDNHDDNDDDNDNNTSWYGINTGAMQMSADYLCKRSYIWNSPM